MGEGPPASDDAGLALEALQPLRARGHLGGQDLEGHVAPELRVGRPVVREGLDDQEVSLSHASIISTCLGVPTSASGID